MVLGLPYCIMHPIRGKIRTRGDGSRVQAQGFGCVVCSGLVSIYGVTLNP